MFSLGNQGNRILSWSQGGSKRMSKSRNIWRLHNKELSGIPKEEMWLHSFCLGSKLSGIFWTYDYWRLIIFIIDPILWTRKVSVYNEHIIGLLKLLEYLWGTSCQQLCKENWWSSFWSIFYQVVGTVQYISGTHLAASFAKK